MTNDHLGKHGEAAGVGGKPAAPCRTSTAPGGAVLELFPDGGSVLFPVELASFRDIGRWLAAGLAVGL